MRADAFNPEMVEEAVMALAEDELIFQRSCLFLLACCCSVVGFGGGFSLFIIVLSSRTARARGETSHCFQCVQH